MTMLAPIPAERPKELLARLDENSRAIAKVVSAQVYLIDNQAARPETLILLHDAVRSLVDTRRSLRAIFEADRAERQRA